MKHFHYRHNFWDKVEFFKKLWQKTYLCSVFFFRFLIPFPWYLFHYYGLIWIILCIPWNTSLEKQAVIFSTIWGLWELLHFNFNLFSWLPFAIYVFYMRIFYFDLVLVLKWVYNFSFTNLFAYDVRKNL